MDCINLSEARARVSLVQSVQACSLNNLIELGEKKSKLIWINECTNQNFAHSANLHAYNPTLIQPNAL